MSSISRDAHVHVINLSGYPCPQSHRAMLCTVKRRTACADCASENGLLSHDLEAGGNLATASEDKSLHVALNERYGQAAGAEIESKAVGQFKFHQDNALRRKTDKGEGRPARSKPAQRELPPAGEIQHAGLEELCCAAHEKKALKNRRAKSNEEPMLDPQGLTRLKMQTPQPSSGPLRLWAQRSILRCVFAGASALVMPHSLCISGTQAREQPSARSSRPN